MQDTIFQAKTVQTAVQWTSPDGNRTIHEIVLERDNGQRHKVKTFSDVIAKQGFSGNVEAYQKDGKRGIEVYVRQAPKDDAKGPQKAPERDNDGRSFYYAYAKDLVVAFIETAEIKDIDTAVGMVSHYGDQLYEAATHPSTTQPSQTPNHEPTPDDLASLKDVFPEVHGAETATDGYDPLFN